MDIKAIQLKIWFPMDLPETSFLWNSKRFDYIQVVDAI